MNRADTVRMTAAEYREMILSDGSKKANKYRNKKTEIDGRIFDSKAEARRYEELKLLVRTGELKGFICQPSYPLPGKTRYLADFFVMDKDGNVWLEDVKGMETRVFINKRRLWEEIYPWLELRIIK